MSLTGCVRVGPSPLTGAASAAQLDGRAILSRISEVLATHRTNARDDLRITIMRYRHLYNRYVPHKAEGNQRSLRR